MSESRVTLSSAGESCVLHAFGEEVHLQLTGTETGNRFTQWLEITPPGGGPPPHFHDHEDEWFYVVEGRVSFLHDGTWTETGPGTRVHVPKSVIHTFKNTGEGPSKMVITSSPSGFETFFTRCAGEFSAPGGPDMSHILEIAADHGIHFLDA